MSAREKCIGGCQGAPTRAGLWFCRFCEYATSRPKCYRLGCPKQAIDVVIDKLAITPYKPVCEDHKAGAKWRR